MLLPGAVLAVAKPLKLKGPAQKPSSKRSRKDASSKLTLLQSAPSSSGDPSVKQAAKQESRAGKKELQAALASILSKESSSTDALIQKLLEDNSSMVEGSSFGYVFFSFSLDSSYFLSLESLC